MVQTLADIPNSRARQNELHYRLKHLERADRIQLLCATLDDPYPPIRHDVADALQRELSWSHGSGRPDAATLTRFLEATASGQAPSARVAKAVGVPRQLLAHDSERARVAACVALEASPHPEQTLRVLEPLMDAESANLRYHVLLAIHRLAADSPADRRATLRGLADDDPEIVVIATQIAVQNCRADLMDRCIEARGRLSGEDRLQVTFSIGALVECCSLDPHQLPRPAREAMVEECIDALGHEPHLAAAAKTLAAFDAQRGADALVDVTKKWFAHPILKVEAAAALIDLDHPRGQEYIEKALGSRRKDARGYALRIVGSRRLDRFFSHLVDVATDDVYHSDTATIALADYGGERARQILRDLAASHPNDEVRELADAALDNRLEDQFYQPGADAEFGATDRSFDTPLKR